MVDLKASAFAGRWLAIATLIALVQIVIGAAVHATKLVDTTTPRIILPLYIYPEGDAWNPLFTAIKNNPTAAFTIVINPDSGPGQGTDPGADYSDNIKKLRATADTNQILELVGYVATGYGDKDPGLVKSQVLQYHNWTSAIRPDGIFFDETSTSSKWLSTYSGYTDFVKSLDWGVDTSSVKSITAIVKPVATSTRSTSTPKAVSTSKPKSTNKPTSSQKPKSTKKASTSTKKPKSTKTAKKPTSKRKTTNKHKRSNQNTAITILNPGTWPEDPRFYSTSADHIVVYESPLSNFDYAEYQSLTAGSNAGSDFQRAYIFNEVDPRNIATKDGKKFASIQQLVDGTIHGLNSTGGIFVSDLGEPQVYTEFSNVWQEFVTDVVAVST